MAKRNITWFINKHQDLKEERDELLNEVKVVKKKIEKLEGEALVKFDKEDIEGAKSEYATAYIEEREHLSIADRRTFEKYVKRTGFMELFQNRISIEAYRELVAQGYKPAGVGSYTEVNFRTRRRS